MAFSYVCFNLIWGVHGREGCICADKGSGRLSGSGGTLCGLRDFSNFVFIPIKPVLYYCSLKALFSQMHVNVIEREKVCYLLGKMLRLEVEWELFQWFYLPKSQIISKSYSEVGYFNRSNTAVTMMVIARHRRKCRQMGVLSTRKILTGGCSLWRCLRQWCTNPEDKLRGCWLNPKLSSSQPWFVGPPS